MTDENDITTSEGEELRTLYSCEPRERVPPHLDKIVMRGASNEIHKSAALGGFLQWRQPAAFATTIALAFVLVFQWNEIPLLQQSSDVESEPGFASEAADGSARMRELGRTATHRFLGQDEAANSPLVPGSDAASTAPQRREESMCRDERIESPDSWLTCIARLREGGFAQEANAELAELFLAHPKFQITQ